MLSGIDIVEVERIKNNILEKKEQFLNRIYTENEIKYCEARNVQKYESYAARFAAKEAIYKAISNYINFEYSWKDFEIVNLANGRPEVKLHFKINSIKKIDISMSHTKQYAIASVVVTMDEGE